MPAKNLGRKNEEGIYSHIYNKGVEQRIIFNDKEDYEVFQGFLRDYLTAPQDPESTKQTFTVHGRIFRGTPHQPKNYFNKVQLIAYSLMPDHFHLILYQKTHGSIESFIRSICTRYSIYFNKKYERAGALFEGPYKSVQLKDESLLLHLTRYLHHTGTYSSYPEYLGTRVTSWVNTKVVFSFFAQGPSSYKNFVEKYEPNQKEKELLSRITFESQTEHLERRDLTRNVRKPPPEATPQPSKKIRQNSNLKPQQRIPEFLAATAIFSLLLGIGITNIMISQKSRTKAVTLGIATSIFSTSSSPPEVSDSPIPTPIPSPLVEERRSQTILVININDGEATVNIREKPTTDSKKIGKAKDGDTFELVSVGSEWYEVKLADGSTGFITAKYIKTGGNN